VERDAQVPSGRLETVSLEELPEIRVQVEKRCDPVIGHNGLLSRTDRD
jgi:hypothetical protein